MAYVLKLYNQELLKFEIIDNLSDPVLRILGIDGERENLLPLGMEATDEGLGRWMKNRSIPKNRAYVSNFLAKCGLNANRPMDVIAVCKGLSLNDAYWVTTDEDDRDFDAVNLYENNFSRILGLIAFTGYGSKVQSSFASSPEFTTNGMLPKCWRRENGKINLYKGGTSGASNTGNEPYSELYAYQVGRQMDVQIVPYKLKRWKGQLCSTCELFTSKSIAYVPIGRIVKTGGLKAVREYYEKLGPEFVQALNEMIVFDAVIMNTDRHFGNFGVLVDSATNKIIAPAPLFDHGNSLLNFAGDENWRDERELREYAETMRPCVYDDFIQEAQKYMDHDMKKKVRKLLRWELHAVGRYNYPGNKLKALSNIIHERAQMLL